MSGKEIIFISHTHRDAELADLLKQFVEASLDLRDAQVFCSSSPDFVPDYIVDIATQIKDGLVSTTVAFVLLTPYSLTSHWVLFEAGAVFVRGKMIIPILSPELSYQDLPAALKGRQCIETGAYDAAIKLENAIKAISQNFDFSEQTGGNRRVKLDAFLKACRTWAEVQQAAGKEIELLYLLKRGDIEHVLCAPRISNSPFEFQNLIEKAKEELFVAGQNLYFLTNGPNSREIRMLIENFIKSGKRMRIMICDPDFKEHIPTWSVAVNAEGYSAQLKKSVETFKIWVKEIRGLEVRVTKFIPTSMTFMDPESRQYDGLLVFTPHAFRPETALRPCFAMSKHLHKTVFDEYWNYYNQIWIDEGGRTRMLIA